MTNSRSSTSRSNWLACVVALVVLCGVANAGGRKRVVVLDFDGPKAEKFHDDIVKLIKKSHTVVAVDKWNGAAEEMDAAKVTEKNVKKVAKKLKIDGIISGKIEKRRDEYIIQLKLRSGTTGELVGNRVDTKSEEPRLDSKAQREIKDELVGAIDDLEANHGGGGDDDGDDKASSKKKHGDDEGGDDDDKGPKKGFAKKKMMDDAGDDDADAKKAKKDDKKAKKDDAEDDDADAKKAKKDDKKAKKDDDDDAFKKAKKDDKKKKDDEVAALSTKKDDEAKQDDKKDEKKDEKKDDDSGDDGESKKKHKKKKVAKGGDDDDGGSSTEVHDETPAVVGAEALTPANRAVDFVIGMSFTARRLSFNSDADLADPPPAYKQSLPVAGGIMDVIVYPMAFSHKNQGFINGLGLEVMYDKVIFINSKKNYIDSMMTQQTATLSTVEARASIGAVVRYPVNPGLVIGGKLLYSDQQFNIEQKLPNNSPTDVPNVHYKMVEPKAFLHYTMSPQMVVNGDLGFMAVFNTGGIQQTMTGYGPASVYGFEVGAGIDYNLTKNIFIRAMAKFETINLKFKGDPNSLSNTRDTDPMQDVQGASDVYFGGMGTIGYSY